MIKTSPPKPTITRAEILILFLLAIAAYGLAAIYYHPFADDLMVMASGPERLTDPGHDGYGIWRLLNSYVLGEGLRHAPSFYLFGIVLLHAVNGCLLLRILRQLGASVRLSLLAAAFYVTLPWYHEAIAWAAANCYVIGASFFLGTLTLALDWEPDRKNPARTFLLLFSLTFIGNLFGEQLAFTCMAIPLLVVLWREGFPRRRTHLMRYWPLLGTTAAVVLFILLYALTIVPGSAKDSHLNPRTLISAFYYQHYSFTAYLPWWHLDQLGNLRSSRINFSLIIPVVALPLIIAFIQIRRRLSTDPVTATSNPSSLPALSIAALILLVSIVIVFVIGGGYSLDSRKRYDITLGLVLALVPLLARWRWNAPRWILFFVLAFITINVATTNLLTAIYKTEIARYEQLMKSPQATSGNRIYQLEPYAGRESLWRDLRPYWEGFYLDILLPSTLKGTAAPRAYFDLKQDRWVFEE